MAEELTGDGSLRAVLLVEGDSDRAAVEALAGRLGLDLRLQGAAVLSIGGATNIRRAVRGLLPLLGDARIAGLCDAGEQRYFAAAFEETVRASGRPPRREQVFVCVDDLEDELIRARGTEGVEAVVESLGELRMWRTFQRQPAQRDKPREAQLRRFLGTHSGRKERYARAIVESLSLDRVPEPLAQALRFVE
jgi:hypothetical protein